MFLTTKTNQKAKTWYSFLLLICLVLLIIISGSWRNPNQAVCVEKLQEIETYFPYNPLVYHLDLCILSYHLHGQTIAWPYDPYYNEANKQSGLKDQMMKKVKTWSLTKGDEQKLNINNKAGFRGPGSLNGFENNSAHDPIIYKYNKIYPWNPTLVVGEDEFVEWDAPDVITRQIKKVYICYRKTGKSKNEIALDTLAAQKSDARFNARDVLMAFEGGTGDKGVAGQPSSQSIIGFVLQRYWPSGSNYDVHIVFRASRSGDPYKAAFDAWSDNNASGNPDWITDFGYDLVGPTSGGGHISTTGSVHRGMAKCLELTYPQLYKCLREIQITSGSKRPSRIYVTGHSLGAGLAQHLVSSVLMGNLYGPDGSGPSMPSELRNWPWKQIKLVTFSAPRVGNENWAEKLTKSYLQSEFFSTAISPVDFDAYGTTNSKIIPRISNLNTPCGFRVLISSDPITTSKLSGGKHVGKTIYVNKNSDYDLIAIPDIDSHDPMKIRNLMTTKLKDAQIPQTVWKYYKLQDLAPNLISAKRGTASEYQKIAAAIQKYYVDKRAYFNAAEYNADLNAFLGILPP